MFTNNPVTPTRLEILIDLLREYPRGLPRQEVYQLLQPRSLNPSTGGGSPSASTVKAGTDLQLILDDKGVLSQSATCRKFENSRDAILQAFDALVLGSTEIEKYFALFYAYYLCLGKSVYEFRSYNNEQWANHFNDSVFSSEAQENRFNDTKLTGLHRWLNYIGLGWYDPNGKFQANPYERLQRVLPTIFAKKSELKIEDFMMNLAQICPELDGGSIFKQANPQWRKSDMRCTLGLSHALIELHLDNVIRLSCPADTSGLIGWDIGDASPPSDKDIRSSKIQGIVFLKKNL